MGTEDNNFGKILSRQQIAIVINSVMDDRPIRMFELLGAGVGAEFYCNNVPSIQEMHLVEMGKKKFNNWLNNEYVKFKDNVPSNIQFVLHNADAAEVFERPYTKPFNVVNLDFCTYFYSNGKENCTAYPIYSLLKNRKLEDDGLLLLTFQLTGIGANLDSRSITTREEIIEEIGKIAKDTDWSIDEVVFSYTYKSSKPTRMLNLGLRMKYNGEQTIETKK